MTYAGLRHQYEPPEPGLETDSLADNPTRRIAIGIDLRGDIFRQRFAYPVIVEMWEKKNSGRVKREWLKTFTEAERSRISRWQTKFRRWHLQTGTPARVVMDVSTFGLLERALNFFGTI